MKIGTKVIVKECHTYPLLVGQHGVVVGGGNEKYNNTVAINGILEPQFCFRDDELEVEGGGPGEEVKAVSDIPVPEVFVKGLG